MGSFKMLTEAIQYLLRALDLRILLQESFNGVHSKTASSNRLEFYLSFSLG